MGGSPGGYYPPMGASMMSGPGPGTAAPLSAEARQRSVTLRVQRPLPAGLHLSVDGQSVSRSSSSLPDSKARQITQTAYWPDQQMEGSVGVRFASKTVARELLASNRAGETLANNQGGVEARLGPWKQGSDLQTEILLEGVQPNDPRFVLVAQAVDVDGTTHPGRIEHRQKGSMREYSPDYSSIGMGSEGTGPMAGAMSGGGKGEWQMVFPHLPADRIAQIRLTWHPYAWVIIRNISLEPDHKTTPTAELYIDQSKPPAAPNPVEGPAAPPPNGPSAVLRVVPLQY